MWSFQNSTTLAVKDAIHLDDLITVATAALVGYDYVLTVSRELRLFWKGSINVASILYFTNRYLAVLYYVGLAYYRRLVLPFPECQVQNYFNIGIRYLQYLPWAVFSALRVYALSRKHWGLSGVTFFSLVLALALNYYGNFHHRSFYTDSTITSGCVTAATTPTVLSLVGSVVITGGQIIGDAIAMGITWKATYHARRDSSLSFLTRVMFRNGTVYFVILLALNVLHLIFVFLPDSPLHPPSTNTTYIRDFSEPITAILTSHFILDLHEMNYRMAHQESLSGIQVIGSLDTLRATSAPDTEDLLAEEHARDLVNV